jgi:cytidylate kinase
MDYRADRIVRLYGDSEKSPQTRLKEKDKRRSVNYQHYTGRNWGAAENYDICLNTAKIGVENAAQVILSLLKEEE